MSLDVAISEAGRVGFQLVAWTPTAEQERQLEEAQRVAKHLGRNPPQAYAELNLALRPGATIEGSHLLLLLPLTILQLDSRARAEERLAADQPLFRDELTPDEQAVLPDGFQVQRLYEVAGCNLMLTSYDDGTDPSLVRRREELVVRLAKMC